MLKHRLAVAIRTALAPYIPKLKQWVLRGLGYKTGRSIFYVNVTDYERWIAEAQTEIDKISQES